jgi:hypothetical protein
VSSLGRWFSTFVAAAAGALFAASGTFMLFPPTNPGFVIVAAVDFFFALRVMAMERETARRIR